MHYWSEKDLWKVNLYTRQVLVVLYDVSIELPLVELCMLPSSGGVDIEQKLSDVSSLLQNMCLEYILHTFTRAFYLQREKGQYFIFTLWI